MSECQETPNVAADLRHLSIAEADAGDIQVQVQSGLRSQTMFQNV